MSWIKVENDCEKPTYDSHFLALYDSAIIDVRWFKMITWQELIKGGYYTGPMKYWQPLPELPEEMK